MWNWGICHSWHDECKCYYQLYEVFSLYLFINADQWSKLVIFHCVLIIWDNTYWIMYKNQSDTKLESVISLRNNIHYIDLMFSISTILSQPPDLLLIYLCMSACSMSNQMCILWIVAWHMVKQHCFCHLEQEVIVPYSQIPPVCFHLEI